MPWVIFTILTSDSLFLCRCNKKVLPPKFFKYASLPYCIHLPQKIVRVFLNRRNNYGPVLIFSPIFLRRLHDGEEEMRRNGINSSSKTGSRHTHNTIFLHFIICSNSSCNSCCCHFYFFVVDHVNLVPANFLVALDASLSSWLMVILELLA